MQDALDIGIDVAKAELEIAVVDHPECNITVLNTAAAIKRWLHQLPPGSRIAVEATGKYHTLVVAPALESGFSAFVLNPRDVYFYVKALGQRGKTDRTDAQVISRYLREHLEHLHPCKLGSPAEQQVSRLLQRRALLVVQRDSLERSLQDLPSLSKRVRRLIEQFTCLLATIDEQIDDQIHSQADLAASSRLLQTVPGIGAQGAAMLTCLFRGINFSNADAVVAFSGLDPRPMDSGQKPGKRRLTKRGPSLLRRQLYMMAFAAGRTRTFKPVTSPCVPVASAARLPS